MTRYSWTVRVAMYRGVYFQLKYPVAYISFKQQLNKMNDAYGFNLCPAEWISHVMTGQSGSVG
jgi:hypothetical protein